MANPIIIAFDRNGPGGLGLSAIEESSDDLPLIPGSGVRVQRGDNYFTDDTGKCIAGIWECTPCQTVLAPYPVDEFMILLEGSVALIDESGIETTYRAGEALVIPKGAVVSWKQTETVRKFYVMPLDEDIGVGPPESLTAHRIDPTGKRLVYADHSRQFTAGIKELTVESLASLPFPRTELLHILEGEVTIDARTFGVGDTLLVSKGAMCKWYTSRRVRAIFCSWQPKLSSGVE